MWSQKNRDINEEAMVRMTDLNDRLRACGCTDKEREILLVRLLLCFFSEDTGAFGRSSFFNVLLSDELRDRRPGDRLKLLFDVLAGVRTGEEPGCLSGFPVLGRAVFAEPVPMDSLDDFFLLEVSACREIPWREISPAIFGAMFQEIMNQDDRREWGAYYTSEENIDRLIDPLFMNELLMERESCRGSRRKLSAFHDKLSSLTFLDPACGCGNFLIRIYTRLRELELDVVEELYDTDQRVLDVSIYCHVSPVQFLGIELEHFQAVTARVCMWICERQMDLKAASRFGVENIAPALISPLAIREGNALAVNWEDFVSRERLKYIVGNPPFVGARRMTRSQKADMAMVFGRRAGVGNMDYVTAWYRKAAEFMSGTGIRAAFVSTNSICQGEQASLLWKDLTETWHMQIDFAWRTFVWNNAVSGQAKVHCIIVGFSDASVPCRGEQHSSLRQIYDASGVQFVGHINAYLVPGEDAWIGARSRPAGPVPEMVFGSMANDGGNLILSSGERRELIEKYPHVREWIHPFLGAAEYINGKERFCLWLPDVDPERIREIPEIEERVKRVREFRLASPREATRKLADFPHRFGEIRQPESGNMILVPRVSSMRRPYIPVGFIRCDWIASDAVFIIPGGDEALFAILTSSLHMIWVRAVAGRLKSDFRYSASVVYNNFPFPELGDSDRRDLEEAGKRILRIRRNHLGASLADLYGEQTMPGDLRSAHGELDELTDRIFGCTGMSENEKLSYLLTGAARV